jgi:hypothetical protein
MARGAPDGAGRRRTSAGTGVPWRRDGDAAARRGLTGSSAGEVSSRRRRQLRSCETTAGGVAHPAHQHRRRSTQQRPASAAHSASAGAWRHQPFRTRRSSTLAPWPWLHGRTPPALDVQLGACGRCSCSSVHRRACAALSGAVRRTRRGDEQRSAASARRPLHLLLAADIIAAPLRFAHPARRARRATQRRCLRGARCAR